MTSHATSDAPTVSAAGILLMTRPTADHAPPSFLLMRHADRWDLPKGHAEPNESLQQTALRETEEETGIAASRIELDPTFRFSLSYPVRYRNHDNRIFQKTVHYFLGYVDETCDIDCTEHLGAEWFRWNPPHAIQTQTIDPLLAAVQRHLMSAGT